MGRPAARISDMHVCPMVTGLVPHVGGPIIIGSENVFTGGLPQARLGDMATCIGPPDFIAMGSSGVFVNGLPAARLGDPTAHGGVIVLGFSTVLIGETADGGGGGDSDSGAGLAPASEGGNLFLAFVNVATQVSALRDAAAKGLAYVETHFDGHFTSKATANSVSAQGDASFAAVTGKEAIKQLIGPVSLAPSYKILSADASGSATLGPNGGGISANAEASAITGKASVMVGSPNNPFIEVGAEDDGLTAEANAKYLEGTDGHLRGWAAGAGASAAANSSEVTAEINIPLPFSNWTVSLRGGGSVDLGSVGADVEGHAVQDTDTGRYHLGGSGEVDLLGGLGVFVDLSVGPPYTSRDRLY